MSPMHVALPSAIEKEAKTRALQFTLSSWEDDEQNELSYEEVLEALRQPANQTYVTDERILVWEAFEGHGGERVAEIIEDLYGSYVAMAESAIRVERNSVIDMVRVAMRNADSRNLPAGAFAQVFLSLLLTKDSRSE